MAQAIVSEVVALPATDRRESFGERFDRLAREGLEPFQDVLAEHIGGDPVRALEVLARPGQAMRTAYATADLFFRGEDAPLRARIHWGFDVLRALVRTLVKRCEERGAGLPATYPSLHTFLYREERHGSAKGRGRNRKKQ